MKIGINPLGFCSAHLFGEFFEARTSDTRNTPKAFQQGLTRLPTNALNVGERGHRKSCRAFVAVEGDAEAVGLVADVAHNFQRSLFPLLRHYKILIGDGVVPHFE